MVRDPNELLKRAALMDQRRQAQLRNQTATINRLLAGASYDDEMKTLHEQLAETQVKLEEALSRPGDVSGQQYTLGTGEGV